MQKYGLDEGGQTQRFLMQNVLRRLPKYMPYQSGAMIKNMITSTPIDGDQIIVPGPYARVTYYGKVMVDSETGIAGFLTQDGWKSRKGSTKVPSDRDMNYNQEKNPQAGPYWDKALIAAEGEVIAKETESYAKYIAGRNG